MELTVRISLWSGHASEFAFIIYDILEQSSTATLSPGNSQWWCHPRGLDQFKCTPNTLPGYLCSRQTFLSLCVQWTYTGFPTDNLPAFFANHPSSPFWSSKLWHLLEWSPQGNFSVSIFAQPQQLFVAILLYVEAVQIGGWKSGPKPF